VRRRARDVAVAQQRLEHRQQVQVWRIHTVDESNLCHRFD
jgi:hypothetical protein